MIVVSAIRGLDGVMMSPSAEAPLIASTLRLSLRI